MSKRKLEKQAKQEVFNTKNFFVKNIKRYLITLAISVPIIMVLNYVLSTSLDWYKGTVSFFVSLTLLLFSCFLALIIFTKKDDKEKRTSNKEKERDPFAD